jgi:hypothetical protein
LLMDTLKKDAIIKAIQPTEPWWKPQSSLPNLAKQKTALQI